MRYLSAAVQTHILYEARRLFLPSKTVQFYAGPGEFSMGYNLTLLDEREAR